MGFIRSFLYEGGLNMVNFKGRGLLLRRVNLVNFVGRGLFLYFFGKGACFDSFLKEGG